MPYKRPPAAIPPKPVSQAELFCIQPSHPTSTADIAAAHDFLRRYDVKYIIVGQFERILYPDGLAKFDIYDGVAWKSVYQEGQTTIYEVLP